MKRAWLLLLTVGCSDSAEVARLREEQAALRTEVDALTLRVAELESRRPGAGLAPAEPAVPLPPPAWLAEADDGSWYVRKDARPTLEDLSRAARALPHRDGEGVVDGYRISAIRRTSGLDLLGFKNGDILHEVNGVELIDTASATAAWENIRQADAMTFRVTRRGEPVEVAIAVR